MGLIRIHFQSQNRDIGHWSADFWVMNWRGIYIYIKYIHYEASLMAGWPWLSPFRHSRQWSLAMCSASHDAETSWCRGCLTKRSFPSWLCQRGKTPNSWQESGGNMIINQHIGGWYHFLDKTSHKLVYFCTSNYRYVTLCMPTYNRTRRVLQASVSPWFTMFN